MSTVRITLDRTQFNNDEWKSARSFSAIVPDGNFLWLGCDEGTQVDRLERDGSGNYGAHRRVPLGPALGLPGGSSEIDIEGLDVDDGYLWITGSHSLKRTKMKAGLTVAENLARLSERISDGNRYLLGRIPVDESGGRRAARLEGDSKGSVLSDMLLADPLISRFCAIPSKDNGLDIEGLAVRGGRVWLGLRGPVLRGWAVVLDFQVAEASPGRLAIHGPMRRHLLELGGLGVRDLAIRGSDLYILTGPTMDLDGPCHVRHWRGALDSTGDTVTHKESIDLLLELAVGKGDDHPEGMAFLDDTHVIICYDQPASRRLDQQGQTSADVFELSRQ